MVTAYSLVTVAHDAEDWLLRLQARSLQRHLADDLFDEILVIDNSAPGRTLDTTRLLPGYGRHASKVRLVRARDLGHIPEARGWQTQQVAKLLAARFIRTPRYLVLDAKNHLVAPLRRSFFDAADGRMRNRCHDYTDHDLRVAFERTLSFCGLDPLRYVGWFTATATPFPMKTDDVLEAIAFVEEKSGLDFATAFVLRNLTEFFLLGARLAARNVLDATYAFGQIECPVIWPHRTSFDAVATVLNQLDRAGAPFFAVHRNALRHMPDSSLRRIASLWTERGLHDDAGRAFDDAAAYRSALNEPG